LNNLLAKPLKAKQLRAERYSLAYRIITEINKENHVKKWVNVILTFTFNVNKYF